MSLRATARSVVVMSSQNELIQGATQREAGWAGTPGVGQRQSGLGVPICRSRERQIRVLSIRWVTFH